MFAVSYCYQQLSTAINSLLIAYQQIGAMLCCQLLPAVASCCQLLPAVDSRGGFKAC